MSSRSPVPTQRRVIYTNLETPNKDPSTIFHSPYTNGKKSKEYTNPTLISSSVFYDYKLNNVDIKSGQLDHSGRPKSPINQQNEHISNQDRSNTPVQKATPERSKTPRRKRQFDNTREHIRDHFQAGMMIQAETKRPLKKYNFSNTVTDFSQSCLNNNQETMKFYLDKIQDRSMHKSASNINLDQNFKVGTNEQSNNVSAFVDQVSTPLKKNSSFININKRDDDENYNSQLQNFSTRNGRQQEYSQPQTPNRVRDSSNNRQVNGGGGYERSMTPNTMQRYLNDQLQHQTATPKRYENHNSTGDVRQNRSLTPTAYAKYRQSFTPLKECCDQCINLKMMDQKQQRKKEEKEKDYLDQKSINQKYNDEQIRFKELTKQKQEQVRRQYGEYVKIKNEEDKQKKQDKIQENIIYNQKMNKQFEQEKQMELERIKNQKIQKIKMYSQQLKEQIEQKEIQRKNQIEKQRQESERNQQLQAKVQYERTRMQNKFVPTVVEYREQLLNQQIEQDMQKYKQKDQEQLFYKKIQEQVSKYSEQEKELLRQIKQKKKQDYESFIKQKEQILIQAKEEKKKEEKEVRQKFQNIENEDHLQKLNSRRIENIKKQNFCNVLKDQIQQKEILQQQLKQEDIKKSQSTTLLINNSSYQNLPINSLSPCTQCHKKVPKFQLALYN
ncbi:hypothetical protein TTHERM_00011900 (macronuclear) [Tetrahymena thermophila SB210]|uniref:Uncharacterized protein n=1 Tax=Tetrahymena thermophila (strain SB210) TaxID=312017 RepID=Q22RU8_TETTS|nr:hypothetical protein TTHERM_00011900 [Tetrahymena thermophila SB210]EAR88024.1 hypothetical protein TTHERM_00011900 [Tetrahymena thermophila SB210]|eukprot:XP_001008269.1 hypothetical protein TTHERM_00011900 [Tetrahymena thermophila SB210]